MHRPHLFPKPELPPEKKMMRNPARQSGTLPQRNRAPPSKPDSPPNRKLPRNRESLLNRALPYPEQPEQRTYPEQPEQPEHCPQDLRFCRAD